jgi:hypothetical protein
MRTGLGVVLLALACAVSTACAGDPRTSSPASPSSLPVTADTFAGVWTSATASTPVPLAACSRFDYTVAKAGDRAVSLKVAATCAGLTLDASGSGTVGASALNWTAQGTATGTSGAECSFSFADSTATPLNDGTVRIDYKGKVCGVPVNGSEIVRKK